MLPSMAASFNESNMPTEFHQYDCRSTSLKTSSIPSNCFLSGIGVFDVNEDDQLEGDSSAPGFAIAEKSLASGTAEVNSNGLPVDSSSAIAIPVFRGRKVVSVVCLIARVKDETVEDPIGVFEVWEPIGAYEEVALKAGFYGKMERFQNVSSFVRFEKGNGLPGQVWQNRCGIIHDQLSEHPGFLRAAGASADLLRTAIGIPVADEAFHASAVLISSQSTPIARGMEVWKVLQDSSEFELASAAYYQLGDGYALPIGTQTTAFQRNGNETLFAKVRDSKRAVVIDDPDMLLAGRNPEDALPGPTSGLAIPFFDGQTLTSITMLLF